MPKSGMTASYPWPRNPSLRMTENIHSQADPLPEPTFVLATTLPNVGLP